MLNLSMKEVGRRSAWVDAILGNNTRVEWYQLGLARQLGVLDALTAYDRYMPESTHNQYMGRIKEYISLMMVAMADDVIEDVIDNNIKALDRYQQFSSAGHEYIHRTVVRAIQENQADLAGVVLDCLHVEPVEIEF